MIWVCECFECIVFIIYYRNANGQCNSHILDSYDIWFIKWCICVKKIYTWYTEACLIPLRRSDIFVWFSCYKIASKNIFAFLHFIIKFFYFFLQEKYLKKRSWKRKLCFDDIQIFTAQKKYPRDDRKINKKLSIIKLIFNDFVDILQFFNCKCICSCLP